MTLAKTISRIKKLEIQGAAGVARAALTALQEEAHRSKAASASTFLKDLEKASKKLKASRATEPYMRNVLDLALDVDESSLRAARENIHKNCQTLLKEMQTWKHTIANIGARKIRKGSRVFIHCHSSNVMAVLKEAAKKRKFEVVNTEARPFYQGRISAEELAKAKIPLTHYVDSAAAVALRDADMMLIGCDAITPTAVVNKIGSGMFAEIAERYGVPVYVCTEALKFDPKTVLGHTEQIEERPLSEVWAKAPGRVKVRNPAFEEVDPDLLAGIISELGVYRHGSFVEEVRREYELH